jgi:hypothetical protein
VTRDWCSNFGVPVEFAAHQDATYILDWELLRLVVSTTVVKVGKVPSCLA